MARRTTVGLGGLRAGHRRGALLGAAAVAVVAAAAALLAVGVTVAEVLATVLFLPVFAAGLLAGRPVGHVAAAVATVLYVVMRGADLSGAGPASAALMVAARAAAYVVVAHVGALTRRHVARGAAGDAPPAATPEARRRPPSADRPGAGRGGTAPGHPGGDRRRAVRAPGSGGSAGPLPAGSAGYGDAPMTTMSREWPPEPPGGTAPWPPAGPSPQRGDAPAVTGGGRLGGEWPVPPSSPWGAPPGGPGSGAPSSRPGADRGAGPDQGRWGQAGGAPAPAPWGSPVEDDGATRPWAIPVEDDEGEGPAWGSPVEDDEVEGPVWGSPVEDDGATRPWAFPVGDEAATVPWGGGTGPGGHAGPRPDEGTGHPSFPGGTPAVGAPPGGPWGAPAEHPGWEPPDPATRPPGPAPWPGPVDDDTWSPATGAGNGWWDEPPAGGPDEVVGEGVPTSPPAREPGRPPRSSDPWDDPVPDEGTAWWGDGGPADAGPPRGAPEGGPPPAVDLPAVDPETGLWTVRFLRDRLSAERARCRRTGRPCSMVLVQVPDGPLAQLPYRRQVTLLRELGYQFVAGGVVDHLVHVPDQQQHWFAVILPDTDRSGAQVLERRLRLGIGGYLASRGLRLRELASASLTAPDDDPAMEQVWEALVGPEDDDVEGPPRW